MEHQGDRRCAVCHNARREGEQFHLVWIATPGAIDELRETGRYPFRQFWAGCCATCHTFVCADDEL